MNNIVDLIKGRPLFMPRILLSNYKSLGITDEELIIIMVIMSYGDKVIYDPVLLTKEINGDKRNVMMLIDNLCDKLLLSIIIEKGNKKAEYITLEPLYEKLSNIVLDNQEEKWIDNSISGVFENELGRTLSPMEYEKIKEWVTSGNSNEMITLALREAVLNGVSNLNYIDSILNSWKKKGYKTKEDIQKDKENYRTKKGKVDVFETDWLND